MYAIVVGTQKESRKITTKKGEAQVFRVWFACKSDKVYGHYTDSYTVADYQLYGGVTLSPGSVVSLYMVKGDDGKFRLKGVYPVDDPQMEYAVKSGGGFGASAS